MSARPAGTAPAAAAEFRRGLVAALPFALSFVPAALVLGDEAARKGFSPVEVPLLTGLNFAGGSEFAAIGLWTSPPHILLIVAVTFLVNSRHILMGATFARYLGRLPRRAVPLVLFLMCDEAWALGLTDAERRAEAGRGPLLSLPYYLGGALFLYVSWVVSTTAGALVGPVLGDVRAVGLDMAFPALFIVLLRGLWRGPRAAAPWVASLIAAGTTYLLVPGGWYVPVGAACGLLAAGVTAERA